MGKKQRKRHLRKIDVADVEEAREDERLTAKYKKQPALCSELFAIDTVGSTKGLSKAVRQELKKEKLPRGFKALSKNAHLQIDRMAAKMERLKKLEEDAAKKGEASLEDPWEAPVEKYCIKKPPMAGKKTCAAPAVVLPDPGQAVNPDKRAYEELVFRAAAEARAEIFEQKDLDRRMHGMTAALVEAFGEEEVNQMDEESKMQRFRQLSYAERPAVTAEAASKTMKERKTQADRNRRERHSAKVRAETLRKKQKTMEKAVGKIPVLLKEMAEDEAARAEKKRYVEQIRENERKLEARGVVVKAKKIGRLAFKEPAVDVPEATGHSLRQVKPTVAAKERIESIYRRNLSEHRAENSRMTLKRVKHQQYKKKRGHKFASAFQRSLLLG